MAHRDRSQGFAFVYVDIKRLLKEKDSFVRDDAPVLIPDDVTRVNVNRDTKAPKENPAVKQIRENLDRLQVLHHKLHAMLDELNQISGKKNPKE